MMGIGTGELAIICLILFMLIVPVVAVGVVLLAMNRKRDGTPK